MKNRVLLLIFAAILFGACSKSDETVRLNAKIERNNSKVVLDASNYACWENGDRLRINNAKTTLGGGIYEVNVDASGNATIDGVVTNGAGYRAVYPTSFATVAPGGYFNPTLPATQSYNASNRIPIPMVAWSGSATQTLVFRAVTALMKVQVQGNVVVKSIVLSADVPLCGTGTINDADESAPVFVPNAGQPTSVTLDCGSGVEVSGSKDFYIIIPAISDEHNRFSITVNVVNENGEIGYYTKSQTSGGSTIGRSELGSVPFNVASATFVGTGKLIGEFSVTSNKKVRFSKGNLRHNDGTWSFADNQYDYVGDGNATAFTNGSGLIDLFGWGTAGNGTYSPYNYYGSTSNGNPYYPYGGNPLTGTNNDWGHNAISNGGNTANQWFTLTQAEWTYLINNHTYKKAAVNGKYGLIILPDGMSTTLNNSYSLSDWKALAAQGAIFLPAAGYRCGASSGENSAVSSVNNRGAYWTATNSGNQAAYYMGFNSDDGPVVANAATTAINVSATRYRGFSVRLVTNAN